jgi:hypothetical protein
MDLRRMQAQMYREKRNNNNKLGHIIQLPEATPPRTTHSEQANNQLHRAGHALAGQAVEPHHRRDAHKVCPSTQARSNSGITPTISGFGRAQHRKLGRRECHVREGLVSHASGSRGSKRREPIPLTTQILLVLDRLEPDKERQGKLLTEHLTGHGILPSTEEELAQILEQRAKKEAEQHMAADEAAKQRTTTDQLDADPPEVVHACIVATFGRKAKEAALAAGATMDQVLEAKERAAAKAEATLSAASAMRE